MLEILDLVVGREGRVAAQVGRLSPAPAAAPLHAGGSALRDGALDPVRRGRSG